MPCRWHWFRNRSWRAIPPRSPMHTTAVVISMTPTYRVKDPADADLPRSFEARSPAKEPGLLFFPPPGLPRRRCTRSACSFTTRIERVPNPLAMRSPLAGTETSLGCPAPSRVCPRTSTGRPGVHVRSGGRLSRAATQLRFAQTGRVACGHSRDGFSCLVSSMDESAGLRSRRLDVRVVHEAPHGGVAQQGEHLPCKQTVAGSMPAASTTMLRWTSGEVLGPSSRRGGFTLSGAAGQGAACCGPQAWRMAPALPHGVPPPSTRSLLSSSRFERRKPAATIGRRRNPSPTTFPSPEAAGSKPAGGAISSFHVSRCVWGWLSPRGPRLQVVTLASPVRIWSATPKRIHHTRGGHHEEENQPQLSRR